MHKQIRRLTFGRLPPGGTVFIMVYMLSPELVESDISKFETTTRINEHLRERHMWLEAQLACRTWHDRGSRGPSSSSGWTLRSHLGWIICIHSFNNSLQCRYSPRNSPEMRKNTESADRQKQIMTGCEELGCSCWMTFKKHLLNWSSEDLARAYPHLVPWNTRSSTNTHTHTQISLFSNLIEQQVPLLPSISDANKYQEKRKIKMEQ